MGLGHPSPGLTWGSAIPRLVPHAARGPKIADEAPHSTQPLGKRQRDRALRGWGSWTKVLATGSREDEERVSRPQGPRERIPCVSRRSHAKPRSPARSLGPRQIMP